MHGVKNVKRNRKLNDNNAHRVVSRYAVVVNGMVNSYHPSEKRAYKKKIWLEHGFWNQDEPVYPNIEIIYEEMELDE